MVSVVKGDVCFFPSDAIVNAGNEPLLGCFTPNHKCLDHQIHEHAGRELTKACQQIMRGRIADPSQCILTPSFGLKKNGIRYVIHAYGPNCTERLFATDRRKAMQCLAQTYINCLDLANENDVKSVAFPALSTGIYQCDPDAAAEVAVQTTLNWLQKTKAQLKVIFVMYPENYQRYQKVLHKKEGY